MRRPSASELRPPVSDILLAGALTALAQFEVWSDMQYQGAPVRPGPKAVVVSMLALTTAAVAWRRIFPLGVLILSGGLISAMALAFGAGDGGPSLFVLLLVLVYSAAAHTDRPVAVAAVAAAVVGIHDLRDDQIGGVGDALFAPVLAAIAFAFGRAVRARHEQAALRAETAVTDERARIARELHDAVAHSVGVMVVQAQGARQILGGDGDPRVGEALAHIERAGQDALVEMRRLLGLLRDGDAPAERTPAPSLEQLRGLLDDVRAAGLDVDLHVTGDPAPLPAGVDQSAYRIVQEALTNVRRHAPGAHATVAVSYRGDEVVVEVVDDGPGQAEGPTSPGGGHGHANMRERAAMCGGTVRVDRRPEGGYAVTAVLPTAGAPA
ncbi:MAG TPA: histidine kinase [Gaiellales bacterium]|nr:histidine kinase [Gaiellales bacterium]